MLLLRLVKMNKNKAILDASGLHLSNLVPIVLILGAIWWIVDLVQENADLKIQNEGFIEVMTYNAQNAESARLATIEIREELGKLKQKQRGRPDGKVSIDIP